MTRYINKIVIFSLFIITIVNANQLESNIKDSNNKIINYTSIVELLTYLDDISWQLYLITEKGNNFEKKELLITQKNNLLQIFIENIRDKNKIIGFNTNENRNNKMKQEMLLSDSKIQKDIYSMIKSEIAISTLELNYQVFTLFINLRKQIDFFSQKQKVMDIIKPTLISLNAMQKDFDNIESLSKTKQKEINLSIAQYRSKLSTAIDLVTYLKWHASDFVPQDTILHSLIRLTLQELSKFMKVGHDNILNIKITLSLICFIVLWAYRKMITKIIVYAMNLAAHLTNQDKELHYRIQKDLLRPVSLFLFAWSLRVCIGVLYYPQLQPENIESWFNILYIINISWFLIATTKSYGTAIFANILQKTNGEFRKEIINLILKLLDTIIVIIAVLLILKNLGFNISAIIASLGLGGLAVALAIKDTLANFFASVMLLLDNSFSQGDWIECSGIEGSVVEIGLRRTTIRTADNSLLFVPNSELADKVIQNWSRRKVGRRIKMSIGVTYDATEKKLKKCIKEINEMLLNHPKIATKSKYNENELYKIALKRDIISYDDFLGYKNAIYVCLETLADSSINILIDCFTEGITKREFLETKEDIIFKVMEIVKNCELSFAFPSQSLYVETFPKIS